MPLVLSPVHCRLCKEKRQLRFLKHQDSWLNPKAIHSALPWSSQSRSCSSLIVFTNMEHVQQLTCKRANPPVLSPVTCTAFCLLHLSNFTLSRVWMLQSPEQRLGGWWQSNTGAVSPAGCSSQNTKLNIIISGRHTAGVQSQYNGHTVRLRTAPHVYFSLHTHLREQGSEKP